MAGSPAAIGLVMADAAMKASAVNIACYMTPSIGTSHSNEVILGISGDASAVKAAVLEARQVGLDSSSAWAATPKSPVHRTCKSKKPAPHTTHPTDKWSWGTGFLLYSLIIEFS